MYANVVTSQYATATDLESALKIVSSRVPEIRKLRGLRSFVAVRTGETRLVWTAVYDAKDNADAARGTLGKQVAGELAPYTIAPPTFEHGPVTIDI